MNPKTNRKVAMVEAGLLEGLRVVEVSSFVAAPARLSMSTTCSARSGYRHLVAARSRLTSRFALGVTDMTSTSRAFPVTRTTR